MINEFERPILDWIQNNLRCGFLDWFFTWFTKLGNGGYLWIAAGIILLFFKKYRSGGLNTLTSLLIGHLVGNMCLKHIVCRARPCWDVAVDMLIHIPTSYSFPSGHTLSSFVAAVCIYKTDKRLGYVAIPVAALMGFSRMYHYVHFTTDVLAGALIGTLIALLTSWYLKPQYDKLLTFVGNKLKK